MESRLYIQSHSKCMNEISRRLQWTQMPEYIVNYTFKSQKKLVSR